MIYLYHKIGGTLDGFEFVFSDVGVVSDVADVSENVCSWRELDRLLQDARAGDALAVLRLGDLGREPRDILRRLYAVIGGLSPLWIGGLVATYSCGRDVVANRAALGLVASGLEAGIGADVLKMPVGRPEVQYPDGWEKMYADWKSGKLAAKDFLERSGLKKATFYNRLADYAPVYERNRAYKGLHRIA